MPLKTLALIVQTPQDVVGVVLQDNVYLVISKDLLEHKDVTETLGSLQDLILAQLAANFQIANHAFSGKLIVSGAVKLPSVWNGVPLLDAQQSIPALALFTLLAVNV